jgi:hypothetical protein
LPILSPPRCRGSASHRHNTAYCNTASCILQYCAVRARASPLPRPPHPNTRARLSPASPPSLSHARSPNPLPPAAGYDSGASPQLPAQALGGAVGGAVGVQFAKPPPLYARAHASATRHSTSPCAAARACTHAADRACAPLLRARSCASAGGMARARVSCRRAVAASATILSPLSRLAMRARVHPQERERRGRRRR